MEHSTVLYDKTKDTIKTEYLTPFHRTLISSKIDKFWGGNQWFDVRMVIKLKGLLINKDKPLERP